MSEAPEDRTRDSGRARAPVGHGERWSIASIAGFAGLMAGLFTSFFVFGERIVRQEERSVTMAGDIQEVKESLRDLTTTVGNLKVRMR